MRYLLLFICTFTVLFTNAQQVTFQGKLFEGGNPVTDQRTIEFFIGSPINWTETHTMQINNGLYAAVLGSINPLPLDLFDANNSTRQLVVRINSNPIDTVTIYAPFERDYTVPENIKDGISWSEVSSIPTIDYSTTNEIQTLSINNDVLTISPNGNSVTLPSGGSGGSNHNLTVYENLTVIDTVPSSTITQTAYDQTTNVQSVWQSFLAQSNGQLRYIKLNFALSANNFVTVKVFDGIGSGGQQLALLVISGISNIQETHTLDVTNMGISIHSGSQYTFQVAAPGGNTINVHWMDADPYPYGYCNFGSPWDLEFDIWTDNSSPSCLTFNNNCYVGIGTDSPTSQLTVAGRIEDQTGFVMPVGFIGSFGGAVAPKGWFLCDGAPKDRIQYAELFNAIGTAWGEGDGQYTFNLPDLRGRFMRGVDNSPTYGPSSPANDPDRTSRTLINPGGNTGNNVGSLQGEELKSHSHTFTITGNVGGVITPGGANGSGGVAYPSTSSVGGSETRPKNAYVNYIIKY